MNAREIPRNEQNEKLENNLDIKKRIGKLFEEFSKRKWMDVIKEINKDVSLDYEKTNQFYLEVREARNRFVHEGDKWAIPEEMPANCIDKIGHILNLFVSLHNYFIPCIYRDKKCNYSSII